MGDLATILGHLEPIKHKAEGIKVTGTYPNIPDAPDDLETVVASIDSALGDQRQEGQFAITQLTLPGGTSYTESIALDHANFTMGELLLYVPNSVLLTSNKRMSCFIMFTTALNDAQAKTGGRKVYNVYGYNFTDYWMKGFRYDEDSKLSDVYFFDDGGQAGLRGQLRIESCQIVGSNIELIFRNTHATRNVRITIKGTWRVFM